MKNVYKYLLMMLLLIAISIGCDKKDKVMILNDHAENWSVSPNEFRHYMSIVAYTNFSQDTLNMLAAFSGESIRGYTRAEQHQGQTIYFLLVYSNDTEEKIGFRLFEANEQRVIGTMDSVEFEAQTGLGSPDNPYEITF